VPWQGFYDHLVPATTIARDLQTSAPRRGSRARRLGGLFRSMLSEPSQQIAATVPSLDRKRHRPSSIQSPAAGPSRVSPVTPLTADTPINSVHDMPLFTEPITSAGGVVPTIRHEIRRYPHETPAPSTAARWFVEVSAELAPGSTCLGILTTLLALCLPPHFVMALGYYPLAVLTIFA